MPATRMMDPIDNQGDASPELSWKCHPSRRSFLRTAMVLLFLLGVQLCGSVSRKLGVHDHGGIVWDEMVGYWLSAAFVPLQWHWLLAAFLLFRFFDILKPWPIRQLDKNVSGGFGIMIDDVVAALFTVLILAVLQRFL